MADHTAYGGVKTPAGLYIHIPFCRSKCPYCHFYSLADRAAVGPFLAALTREMAGYKDQFPVIDTVYIGGGTPSLLTSREMETLFAALHDHFAIVPDGEKTVEVNPADGDGEWFSALRGLGVNRLHLGAQSFSDPYLTFLGRRHTVRDIYGAVDRIVAAGFDNFGLDLIYGLPGQSVEAWHRDIAAAVALQPAHISAYELAVEEDTPFGERHRRGEIDLPGEELSRRFFLETSRRLVQAGYTHYEVSNYARPADRASRHNQKYWRHVPYLGLGPAAHSFRENRRWWNHRDLNAYLTDLNRGVLPIAASEELTPAELRLETLFLGLRTAAGIDLKEYQRRFGADLAATRRPLIAALVKEGLLVHTGRRLLPTTRGMVVADGLSRSLC